MGNPLVHLIVNVPDHQTAVDGLFVGQTEPTVDGRFVLGSSDEEAGPAGAEPHGGGTEIERLNGNRCIDDRPHGVFLRVADDQAGSAAQHRIGASVPSGDKIFHSFGSAHPIDDELRQFTNLFVSIDNDPFDGQTVFRRRGPADNVHKLDDDFFIEGLCVVLSNGPPHPDEGDDVVESRNQVFGKLFAVVGSDSIDADGADGTGGNAMIARNANFCRAIDDGGIILRRVPAVKSRRAGQDTLTTTDASVLVNDDFFHGNGVKNG